MSGAFNRIFQSRLSISAFSRGFLHQAVAVLFRAENSVPGRDKRHQIQHSLNSPEVIQQLLNSQAL